MHKENILEEHLPNLGSAWLPQMHPGLPTWYYIIGEGHTSKREGFKYPSEWKNLKIGMTIPNNKELLDPGCHMWLVGFRGVFFFATKTTSWEFPQMVAWCKKGLFGPQNARNNNSQV